MLSNACIVRLRLEIIHPFEDRNGRQSLTLIKWNPLFEWLPVDLLTTDISQRYYQALTESNEANDSTRFIQFMLEAILRNIA